MAAPDEERTKALDAYRTELIKSREWEAKLKALRLEIKELVKDYDRTEDNIKALQSVGQIIGEVLKQLDDERCRFYTLSRSLVDISSPRLVRNADTQEQSLSRRLPARDMSSAAAPRLTRTSSSKAPVLLST